MANAIAATFPEVSLPVELTTFTGELLEDKTVLLKWETATEVNNYGFQVQRTKEKVQSEESGRILDLFRDTAQQTHQKVIHL